MHLVILTCAWSQCFARPARSAAAPNVDSIGLVVRISGGGGAYICVGVPFDWPQKPATDVWTYFPRKDAVIAKLDEQTPLWKMPLWLWVKHLSGWPFNGYIMSAAFDHTTAPFFQSFVEVQVSNSKSEVRILPHGVSGRLRWRDLQNFESLKPPGKAQEDFVEFIIPIN